MLQQTLPYFRVISIIISMTFFTGCTLFPKKQSGVQDGPPLVERDVSKVPNAIPKVEPYSRYGNPTTYEVLGKRYKVLPTHIGFKEKGIASWYGRKFHGRRTSSGEPYDMFAMTAAHKSLPIPTYAKVKNLKNGKEIIVKINDRGPFVDDRVIDLSYTAAKKLGVYDSGTAPVMITAIDSHAYNKYKNKKSAQVVTSSASYHRPLYVQLGAFRHKHNAEKIANDEKILALVNRNSKLKIEAPSAQTSSLYKVKVGPFINKQDAEAFKSHLAKAFLAKASIVYD